MRFESFVGDSYQSWSSNVSASRAINLYPEVVESKGGKSRVVFHSTPGLTTWVTLPTAPVRGLWAGEDRLFAAAGTALYEVSVAGAATNIGTIADDADHTPVQMFPNGQQLFIVSAGHAYLHDGLTLHEPRFSNGSGVVNTSGTTVTWVSGDKFDASMVGQPFVVNGVTYTVASITSPTVLELTTPAPVLTGQEYGAFGEVVTARTGCFLDSYFIANPPNSKLFYFSAPNNGLEWDPLEVSSKEGYPDNIGAVFADHEELWLFGTHHSTEVWRNEGDADAAGGFRRDPGGFIHNGLVAWWSVCSLAAGLHFLGGDTHGRIVAYRAQGFQPVRVSTHAVEQIWNTYTTVWDAFAYSYIEQGHEFWVINFQTADATWVYDVASQMWHERAYWDGSAFHRHRGRCHAFVFGKHFVGDHTTGNIYEMSQNIHQDLTSQLRRQRIAPYVANEQKEVFHHRLEIDVDITGTAPTVFLDWSDDDGTTWSTQRSKAPSVSGKKGRVFFSRLGSARQRIYRTTIIENVKVAITDAYLDVTPGFS